MNQPVYNLVKNIILKKISVMGGVFSCLRKNFFCFYLGVFFLFSYNKSQQLAECLRKRFSGILHFAMRSNVSTTPGSIYDHRAIAHKNIAYKKNQNQQAQKHK